jgi:aubergine-like protein
LPWLQSGLTVTFGISSGLSGSPIELKANFFKILSRPQWVLYQYHVDFKPVMESRRLRSALMYQHEETLGKARTFDGALLFLPHKLHNTVQYTGGHYSSGGFI